MDLASTQHLNCPSSLTSIMCFFDQIAGDELGDGDESSALVGAPERTIRHQRHQPLRHQSVYFEGQNRPWKKLTW